MRMDADVLAAFKANGIWPISWRKLRVAYYTKQAFEPAAPPANSLRRCLRWSSRF